MVPKRTKGRPKRSSGDAGRDLLITAAQQLLREPQIDLNRKELAIKAGVTPALVTYYFQDQSSLIEAVAQPVVAQYLSDLQSINRDSVGVEVKFRALVKLFLRVSRDNGRLLDGYVDFVKQNHTGQIQFLGSAHRELTIFFKQCETEGYFKPTNVAVAQTVLWGACKIIAQTSSLTTALFNGSESDDEMEDRQATMIIDLLLHGLARSENA